MVLLLDPDAARKRAQKARGEARVESWQELSGNGALAGRELPAADMLAADARITAIAKTLHRPARRGRWMRSARRCSAPCWPGATPNGSCPGRPGDDAQPPAATPTAVTAAYRCTAQASDPRPHGGGGGGRGLGCRGLRGGGRPGLAALAGSVHLTLPAATWLGWSDAPGELPGFGPVDAWTARDLADRLAAHRATRWHVTLTGPEGRAVAHACPVRATPATWRDEPAADPGHPPGQLGAAGPAGGMGRQAERAPGTAGPGAGGLAGLEFAWLGTFPCGHRRAIGAYRRGTGSGTGHVRHRTCAFPGCTARPGAATPTTP